MIISDLKANNFRNFSSLALACHSKVNLFFGENGSGKTSILEMLYCLSYSKSFRTHVIKRLISHDQDKFTLFANVYNETTLKYPLGMEKNTKGDGELRFAGTKTTLAEVTSLLPIQILNNDSFSLINEGPNARRQFMDWGLFHVKQSFLEVWRNYHKALKHRNFALKRGLPLQQIHTWDHLLVDCAEQLTSQRNEYVDHFIAVFLPLLNDFFQIDSLSMSFYSGWPKESSLEVLLEQNISKDYELGYTFYGAHRADLKIKINNKPVEDVLSRGQQKIFVWLMRVSQALVLTEQTKKNPIFLIDDISAELDHKRIEAFSMLFQQMEAQLFVAGICKPDLSYFLSNTESYHLFHVKHNDAELVALE